MRRIIFIKLELVGKTVMVIEKIDCVRKKYDWSVSCLYGKNRVRTRGP